MRSTATPGVRELLRDQFGDDVDALTLRQLARIWGALFSAAHRERALAEYPG
jgi:hypothetical protein